MCGGGERDEGLSPVAPVVRRHAIARRRMAIDREIKMRAKIALVELARIVELVDVTRCLRLLSHNAVVRYC